MKRIFILFIILFCIFNTLNTTAKSKISSLEDIMSHSNSNIIRKEVFSYGRFSSVNDSEFTMKEFIHNNFKDKVFNISKTNKSIVANHASTDGSITITISNSESLNFNKYISIFYSHNVADENIINLRESIRQMLLVFDKDAKVSSQIVGKINKKLSSIEVSSLISSMLSNSSINFNKDYEGNSVSFSGYAKDLQEFIVVNGEKINIQASGKYSLSDNSTYIWVGSPIISTEY